MNSSTHLHFYHRDVMLISILFGEFYSKSKKMLCHVFPVIFAIIDAMIKNLTPCLKAKKALNKYFFNEGKMNLPI